MGHAGSQRQTQVAVQRGTTRMLNRLLGETLDGTEESLLEYIEKQTENNPALETKDSEISTPPRDPRSSTTNDNDDYNNNVDDFGSDAIRYNSRGEVAASIPAYGENNSDQGESLLEHMAPQIDECDFTEHQRTIAEFIVGNLNDWGYLTRSIGEIADDITFREYEYTSADEVDEVLQVVQTFDPPGIAARNVPECIMLQLEHSTHPLAEQAKQMVTNYYNDMVSNHPDRIARGMGISLDEVEDLWHVIRRLNPKPGAPFSTDGLNGNNAISHTFIISVENDEVVAEIPNRIPELSVAVSSRQAMMKYEKTEGHRPLTQDEKTIRDQLKKHITDVDLLVKALSMRRKTLAQTIQAIITIQRDYFLSGGDERELKPMTLKDLSEITGRDASIMSRATNDKYALTPWGTIKMRSLFSEKGVCTDKDGNEVTVATRRIKIELVKIVDAEDKTHPLSDDAIVKALKELGYNVARRTVGKYRDEMQIPPSSKRKVYRKS